MNSHEYRQCTMEYEQCEDSEEYIKEKKADQSVQLCSLIKDLAVYMF